MMSRIALLMALSAVFVFGLGLAGCDSGPDVPPPTTENPVQPLNDEDPAAAADHDHEGHDHEGHDHEGHDHEDHDHEGEAAKEKEEDS